MIRTRTRRGAMRGFTLLELMVVVVIIAILASIAIPSYSRYAYRARRADAHNLLMHIAAAQERYYSTHNKYTNKLTDFGYSTDTNVATEHGYYAISVTTSDSDQKYTATATRQNAQTADVCGNLSIDNAGKKSPDASNASANSNGKCW